MRYNLSDPRYTRVCVNPTCGKEFQQKKPQQKTCSVQCRGWLIAQTRTNSGGTRAKAGLEPRTCQNPECGQEFVPVREIQIACSRVCYRKTPTWQESQRRQDARPERKAAKNERKRLENVDDEDIRRFLNLRGNMRSKHGLDLTLDEYQAWRERQDGYCKICGRAVGGKSAHVDHDHETGALRDELCPTCNVGIGQFQDNPELLRAAADYIERHRVMVP